MDAIKSTIAENFGGPAHKAAAGEHQFDLERVPNLEGKVAVITGGSEGIVSSPQKHLHLPRFFHTDYFQGLWMHPYDAQQGNL